MAIHEVLKSLVISAKVHDLALGSIELHLPHFRPVYHLLKILLEKVFVISAVNSTKYLCIISKFVGLYCVG